MDWAKAKELANSKAPVDGGVTVEAIGPVNVHSLAGYQTSNEQRQTDGDNDEKELPCHTVVEVSGI